MKLPNVDELAQQIRVLNGDGKMGAGQLAEKLLEWLATPPAAAEAPLVPMDFERYLAIREGHFNAASAEYFGARPQIDTNPNRRIFYAGHCKGYDAAQPKGTCGVPGECTTCGAYVIGVMKADSTEPKGWKLVPLQFLQGFSTLAHNYSLNAEAPNYYHGVERDAFSAAYRRCGQSLAELRAMLDTTPSPVNPARPSREWYAHMAKAEIAHEEEHGPIAWPCGGLVNPASAQAGKVSDAEILAIGAKRMSWCLQTELDRLNFVEAVQTIFALRPKAQPLTVTLPDFGEGRLSIMSPAYFGEAFTEKAVFSMLESVGVGIASPTEMPSCK